MNIKRVAFEDERGRKYLSEIPVDMDDGQAHLGVILGPPDVVDRLALPEPLATRLHNELFRRELWNYKEIQKQPNALLGALQAALLTDVQRLTTAYYEIDNEPA